MTFRFVLVLTLLISLASTALAQDAIDLRQERLNRLLADYPTVQTERRGDDLVLLGWAKDASERAKIDAILAAEEGVIDLTTEDIAASDRMIEIDVIIVVVGDTITESTGFDFLQLINIQSQFFAARHKRDGTGFQGPSAFGAVLEDTQWGGLFAAAVDYNVTIANASDESVRVLARPHLTTLNGQEAHFLSGGEIVFKVTGIESGDIKPYPFGIRLDVTPTILKSRTSEGEEQVLLKVSAERTSVLGRLLASETNDDVNFDKTTVSSQAVLRMNETLILSGLYLREYRERKSGFPYLRDVPVLKYLFSNETDVDDVQSAVIFLTPREPGKINEELQKNTQAFLDRREEYVEARNRGPEAIAEFKQRHPDWYKPQPNKYATHIYLSNNSDVYRAIRGEDLSTEGLRRDILSVPTAEEARKKRD
ncbi:type II and III secretion system protein [bacterium]|nr:type II and III secretion system protein [bacterium]